uniref:Uncharacterized protein n=1 Tax=viral metagenome TaxID=1070528 RepID=A0A6C0J0J6_9ZZZZ
MNSVKTTNIVAGISVSLISITFLREVMNDKILDKYGKLGMCGGLILGTT